jgi:hypothetical protein
MAFRPTVVAMIYVKLVSRFSLRTFTVYLRERVPGRPVRLETMSVFVRLTLRPLRLCRGVSEARSLHHKSGRRKVQGWGGPERETSRMRKNRRSC